MRSEQEMLDLIVSTAQQDERVRAVIMNGSRVNPNARRDPFQDFDIVYLVTDVAFFTADHAWIERFGELMIMQMPEMMTDPPPANDGHFGYLMQFADGNRIDLTLFPVNRRAEMDDDSLSVLLLDKDGILPPFPPPSDRDYLPQPPTAKLFHDCCNEFWWVCPYVAKALWRDEIVYAKYHMDPILRDQVLKMLDWYIGVKTDFSRSPGKLGKHYREFLEPELWTLLEQSYSDADRDHTWDALDAMCQLFRRAALPVAEHFGFDYPHGDDARVSAHLQHVRVLPKEAQEMYP